MLERDNKKKHEIKQCKTTRKIKISSWIFFKNFEKEQSILVEIIFEHERSWN